jgi:hypothetical protein
MPKQPETIDRCELIVHTTLEQMGFAIAALTRLGIKNIQHRLVTEVLNYKGRRMHEVGAAEFAAAFVKDHPRFKIGELSAAFRDAGRSPSGAYSAVNKLVEGRIVARNDDGEYVRVEALAAPIDKLPKMRARAKAIRRTSAKRKKLNGHAHHG